MGSEAFVASGDKEKAERVSRNERPTAATIEAADAARRRETSDLGKAIVLSENSIILNDDKDAERRIAKGDRRHRRFSCPLLASAEAKSFCLIPKR